MTDFSSISFRPPNAPPWIVRPRFPIYPELEPSAAGHVFLRKNSP